MTSKLHREHDAQAAMLAYRTGLHAALCKSSPIEKSAELLRAAFMPNSDDNSITAARSEFETYALARGRNLAEADHGREI
jgi:hypothetical protein